MSAIKEKLAQAFAISLSGCIAACVVLLTLNALVILGGFSWHVLVWLGVY